MKSAKRAILSAWSRPLLLAVLAIGVALAVVGSGRAQEAQDQPEQPFRASVINIDEILRQSQEWQDAAQQRADMAERAERVLKPLDRQRRALQKTVHDYPIGTEDRREAEKAFQEKDREYQRKRAEYDRRMKEQFASSYRNIMGKIQQVAGRYAETRGVDLVLKVGSPADMDDQRDLLDVHMQQVVYAGPTLDISDAIVGMLNADYEAPIEEE